MADRYAQWLRVRRSGGSEEQRRAVLEFLGPIRDEVLDGARLEPGETLLDVGCGDGLIGLGALERGAAVVFSDVSEGCLEDCRAVAGDDARYHLASATDLGEIEADVVTTRSVLIYVAEKQRAFDEFLRVLRPGGRISLFEPINRFGMEERRCSWGFRDLDGVASLLAKVVAVLDREEGVTLVDFDERDLVRLAEAAGFRDIRLKLVAEVRDEPPEWRPRDWDVFLDSAPNPLVPTIRDAIASALTEAEAERLAAVLRPQVEQGIGATRRAHAFLTARKPHE